ncbi:uncharacterized protein LOC144868821 isoform X2 [Branchiostoma floridae x Branchiostoma japonicum]
MQEMEHPARRASAVLQKVQTLMEKDVPKCTLKVEPYIEVFSKVKVEIPTDIVNAIPQSFLDKIKEETGAECEENSIRKVIIIKGRWHQVKSSRNMIQAHLLPAIPVGHEQSSSTSSDNLATDKGYSPEKYQNNTNLQQGLGGENDGSIGHVRASGGNMDETCMDWEDEAGGSTLTAQKVSRDHHPQGHYQEKQEGRGSDLGLPVSDDIPRGQRSQSLKLKTDNQSNHSDKHKSFSPGNTSVGEEATAETPRSLDLLKMRDQEKSGTPELIGLDRKKGKYDKGQVSDKERNNIQHTTGHFLASQSLRNRPATIGSSLEDSKTDKTAMQANDKDGAVGGSTQGVDDGCFAVDPHVLHILRQTKKDELKAILTNNHVRILPCESDRFVQFVPMGGAATSNLDEARNAFANLYQQLFGSLTSEEMDLSGYSIPYPKAKKALLQLKEICSLVKVEEKSHQIISFFGTKDDVRSARKVLCDILEIPLHRSQRLPGQSSDPGSSRSFPTHLDQGTSQGNVFFERKLNGVKVTIMQGDITKQRMDVIVNAANEQLSHAGGVARAIVLAGGYPIQEACYNHTRVHGTVKVTGCMSTAAGKLPSKYIIHAVGPVYSRNTSDHDTLQKLRETCKNTFLCACDELRASSIAIPAISTGLFGVPTEICARAMFDAVAEVVDTSASRLGSFEEIRIIDIKSRTAQDIADYFKLALNRAQPRGSRFTSSSQSFSTNFPGSVGQKHAPTEINRHQMGTQSSSSYDRSKKSFADATQTGDGARGFGQSNKSISGQRQSSSLTKEIAASSQTESTDDQDETCAICLEDFKFPKTLPQCKHKFCEDCLDRALKASSQCPICKTVVGTLTGTQPQRGTMKSKVDMFTKLPGYPKHGTIVIDYHFPRGTQGPEHPNPGRPYFATSRRAYLPDNREGREVLALLRRAFNQRLVFTVGTSSSTGLSDNVIWNDIHHKTNIHGGPTNYGYPDPDYLRRVKEELAAKGIK